MDRTAWDHDVSPYHAGEQDLHARLGRKDQQERMGRKMHRTFMPDQHRAFFGQLPLLVAGSVDQDGWPWASILFGKPGFVSTPDDQTMSINAPSLPGDPFANNIAAGAAVSFVGIELPTRRRNRINGVVRERTETELLVDVVQSFGNCPQYIHTRDMAFVRDPHKPHQVKAEHFTTLDGIAQDIVARADTLFVASYSERGDKFTNGGVDVNHRGGKPGFVKIDGNTLTVPDFIGNFAFNTLGNFMVTPKAGLLFIDFRTGDLVQLIGTVDVLWEPTDQVTAFRGAERAWRFHLHHGQRLIAATPMRWQDGEASPNTQLTGDWKQAARTLEAEEQRKAWRPFRVTRIKDESAVIRSFFLEPADGKAGLPHKPGQYLTIRVQPDGADKPLIRTYTLSSSPTDPVYRISVKRTDARGDTPAGAVSSHLHTALRPGDLIDIRAPNGSFWLDTAETRPAVLIARGVGITPMIAMARQAMTDGFARRNLRPLTILHSAQSTAERAFAYDFNTLQQASEGQLRYVSFIDSPAPDEDAGQAFHIAGRITPQVLQSVLPLADYDFFLCGPPPFMQTIYDMLTGLGVRDARIFAEAFGPATLKRRSDPGSGAAAFQEPQTAVVNFAASGFEHPWTPGDGTLLDFAEAHGLTPNHGCRSGACGSCAVRLKAGRVGYRTPPEFTPETGDVLICCAVPADMDDTLELDL